MLIIVGLGQNKGDITKNALSEIKKADVLLVRTLKSEAGKQIKRYNPISMDEIYESATDFNELNSLIVNKVASYLDFSKENADNSKNIVYCVDGDGFTDNTVIDLIDNIDNVEYKIIAGVGSGLSKKPSYSVATFMASDFIDSKVLLDTLVPVHILEIENKYLASDLKLELLSQYDPQTKIIFADNKKSTQIELLELDMQKKYSYLTNIYISGEDALKYSMGDLIRIMSTLSAPDGCEWDKAQTHQTIAKNLLEESYEAVDAIYLDDIDAMQEEFGDVLLQAVFQADISKRLGEFDFNDVVHTLCHKLITRHTHIFGDDKASNKQESLGFWEKAKEKEKNTTTFSQKLATIPKSFTVLQKIQKAYKKSKKEGIAFDLNDIKQDLVSAIDKKDYSKALFNLALLSSESLELESSTTPLYTKLIEELNSLQDSKNKTIDTKKI